MSGPGCAPSTIRIHPTFRRQALGRPSASDRLTFHANALACVDSGIIGTCDKDGSTSSRPRTSTGRFLSGALRRKPAAVAASNQGNSGSPSSSIDPLGPVVTQSFDAFVPQGDHDADALALEWRDWPSFAGPGHCGRWLWLRAADASEQDDSAHRDAQPLHRYHWIADRRLDNPDYRVRSRNESSRGASRTRPLR